MYSGHADMSSEAEASIKPGSEIVGGTSNISNDVQTVEEGQTSVETPNRTDTAGVNDTIKSASDVFTPTDDQSSEEHHSEQSEEENEVSDEQSEDKQSSLLNQEQSTANSETIEHKEGTSKNELVEGATQVVDNDQSESVEEEQPSEPEWEDLLGNGQLMKKVRDKSMSVIWFKD